MDSSRRPWLIGAFAVFVVFVAAFVIVLKGFQDSGNRKAEPTVLGAESVTNGVNVTASVIGVDPIKGELTARLGFQAVGDVAAPDGTLAQDLTLLVNAGTGNVERPFKAGKVMAPTDVTLDLVDGQVTKYPFDHHEAELFASFVTTPPAAGSAAAASTTGSEAVPVSMHVFESLQGYTLDISNARDQAEGTVDALITVNRSSSTLFFAIFVMVLMWLLAIGAVVLALTVLIGGRKVEWPMFPFLAALLFAFPAIRNAVPGTPPIGSLNDYISFFWAEAFVALALLVVLATWVFRPAK